MSTGREEDTFPAVTFLDRLERLFGGFAIPGLIRYIVMINAGVFLLMLMGQPVIPLLYLDRGLVLDGQVWRLVTWIFIPAAAGGGAFGGLLLMLFYLAFMWWCGDMLEATWGTFRLNLYYLLGMFGCTAAAFLFGVGLGSVALNFTLLLALATLAPDQEILFWFFPLKLKWVAMISLVYPYAVIFITGGTVGQLMTAVCLLNYLAFFGPKLMRRMREEQDASARRAKFQAAAKVEESFTMHKCAICGLTEVTAPDQDFRVAADGHEYCSNHLPK